MADKAEFVRQVGEAAARSFQAEMEGVALPSDERGVATLDHITFLGETYRIADSVGLMPLMKFAHAASSGLDSQEMDGLAAMYAMIRDCIDPDDWARFEQDAISKRADAETLMAVVQNTIEVLTARPTQRPSDSSAGPQPTLANSTASSPSRATPKGAADLMSVDELLRRAGA